MFAKSCPLQNVTLIFLITSMHHIHLNSNYQQCEERLALHEPRKGYPSRPRSRPNLRKLEHAFFFHYSTHKHASLHNICRSITFERDFICCIIYHTNINCICSWSFTKNINGQNDAHFYQRRNAFNWF